MIHEAACAGLPILASACCGAVSCFVKDGENGFLFKPANKRSIRKAIERFYPFAGVAVGTNGAEKQETVREDYTVESCRLYFSRIEMMVATTDILSRIALPGVLLLTLTKVIPYFLSYSG